MAAKAGGGDPAMNARLRTILLSAREANMPTDNIARAIKKGTGELPGVVFEEAIYEGYGPGGVAVIVKVTTDNKARTAPEVRSMFTKHGGNLAGAGAVAFQFLHAGQFLVPKEQATEDALLEIALDAGADDVLTNEEGFDVRCNVHAFDKVAQALEQKGIKPASAEIAYIPTSTIPVTDVGVARSLLKLHDSLEELEDVQQVFSNEEMSDEVSAAAQAAP
jgi:YebC/PmpR family DNA-binding regulatory protein